MVFVGRSFRATDRPAHQGYISTAAVGGCVSRRGAVHQPSNLLPPAMLRQSFLWLSNRQGVFKFVRRNALARRFASRFVAGETIDDAISAVRSLNAKGISVSLDLLGESVGNAAEAKATADHYVAL